MGWELGTSMWEGAKTVGSWVGYGLKWSATKIGLGGAMYVKNTGMQLAKQALALDDAIPALIYKPHSRKILNNVGHILLHDIAPILALNYANNAIQIYAHSDDKTDEEAAWYSAYSVMLAALSVANWAVTAYTWRQGVQLFIRTTTLDALGPRAFNHDSQRERITYCIDEKCTLKRHLKGSLREPVLLLTNEALAELVRLIPVSGNSLAAFVRLISNGRYITRSAIPELCERHKSNFMVTEHILALGISYTLTLYGMNSLLGMIEPIAGMPPYLYYRTLQHILLLYYINIAAHMASPKVRPEKTGFPLDILVLYEWVIRFLYDVLFSGLHKRIPVDFKYDPNSKALIPLSTALQVATKVLNSDKEVEITEEAQNTGKISPYMFFGPTATKIKRVIFPPILRGGANEVINDSILLEHWPQLREGVLTTVNKIRETFQSRAVATANIAPESAVIILHRIFGMPKKVTRALLELSRDNDFLEFLDALHDWFNRHAIKTQDNLALTSGKVLHGDTALIQPPEDTSQAEPLTEEQLQTRVPPQEEVNLDSVRLTKSGSETRIGADNFFPGLSRRVSRSKAPAISVATLGASGD